MSFLKNFIMRGLFVAWAGPVVLAIVYGALKTSGVVNEITVDKLVTAVISSVIMAFVAGGISAVYTTDRIHIGLAAVIHMTVLYFDYLVFYLINGYLLTEHIVYFSIIFAAGFFAIWFIIYFTMRIKVKRLNKKMGA